MKLAISLMKSRFALIALAVLMLATLFCVGASAQSAYTFTDLKPLLSRGDTSSAAYAINNLGQVVGVSSGNPNGSFVACLWDPMVGYEPISLGTFPEGTNSNAFAINNLGQVIGWSNGKGPQGNLIGYRSACLWTPETGMAPTYLDIFNSGLSSCATDINDSGQVVGWSSVGSESGADRAAFLWPDPTSGGMVLLDAVWPAWPAGLESSPAINNYGQVACDRPAALWTPSTPNGGPYDVNGQFSGSITSLDFGPWSLNNYGWVVGMKIYSNKIRTAVLWKPYNPNGTTGSVSDLGALNGIRSYTRDINDLGQVVGSSVPLGVKNTDIWHACLWQDVNGVWKVIDLNSYTNLPTGWMLTDAYKINNAGWIIGTATYTSKRVSQNRAFLLKPNP